MRKAFVALEPNIMPLWIYMSIGRVCARNHVSSIWVSTSMCGAGGGADGPCSGHNRAVVGQHVGGGAAGGAGNRLCGPSQEHRGPPSPSYSLSPSPQPVSSPPHPLPASCKSKSPPPPPRNASRQCHLSFEAFDWRCRRGHASESVFLTRHPTTVSWTLHSAICRWPFPLPLISFVWGHDQVPAATVIAAT